MKRTVLALATGSLLLTACASIDGQEGATATAVLEPRSGSQVRGTITFTQVGPDIVRVTGEITGHGKGPKGFHIHEKGDCSDDKGMSAGGHFNPGKHKHGAPYSPERHAGDIGNVTFDDKGVAKINVTVGGISVSRGRPDGIMGRSVIVHAQPDDLRTDPTGNAGGRVACGVIQ